MGHRRPASVTPAVSGGSIAVRQITAEAIIHELRAGGLVGPSGTIHLEILPGNATRCDFSTRAQFKVYQSKRPVCFLTVGHDLGDLWQRTKRFSEACPEIACAPLLRKKARHFELIAIELFEGRCLENLAVAGEMTKERVLGTIDKVIASLERTRRPSSKEVAGHELDRLSVEVLTSPLFSGLDHVLLREVVLPFIRNGALRAPLFSRWTNGDLTAKNVLVDDLGNVRLIDLEFAARTHFYGEDWWRWKSFSNVPAEARDVPALRPQEAEGGWLEALFILRQLSLVHRVNGAQIAVAEAQHRLSRLMEILGQAHSGFQSTLILSSLPSRAHPVQPAPKGPNHVAQLFWSQDGIYREEHSKRANLPSHQEQSLQFLIPSVQGQLHIRFDPVDAVGLLQIAFIRIRSIKNGTTCTTLAMQDEWNGIALGSGLLRLSDTPELNLVSLNTDPALLLPAIDFPEPCDVVFETWVRFLPDLDTLPDFLRQRTGRGSQLVLTDASLLEEGDPSVRDQAVAQLRQANADAVARIQTQEMENSDLRSRLTELSEQNESESAALRDALARLEATTRELALKSSQLDETTKNIAGIKAALNQSRDDLLDRDQRIAAFQQSNAELQARLAESLAQTQSESSARHDALARLEATTQDLALKSSQLDETTKEIAGIKAALDQSRDDLLNRDQTIAALQQSNAELQARLAESLAQTQSESSARHDALARLEATTQDLALKSSQLDETTKEIAGIKAALDQSRDDLLNRDQTIAALQQSNAELQARLATSLISAQTELAARNDALARLTQVSAERDQQSASLEESSRRTIELQITIERQAASLAASDQSISELQQLVAEIAAEKTRLTEEIRSILSVVEEQKTRIADAEHREVEYKARIDCLYAADADSRKQIESLAESLRNETNSNAQKVNRLTEERKTFENALVVQAEFFEKERAAFVAQVAGLKATEDSLRSEIELLIKAQSHLTTELASIEQSAAVRVSRSLRLIPTRKHE